MAALFARAHEQALQGRLARLFAPRGVVAFARLERLPRRQVDVAVVLVQLDVHAPRKIPLLQVAQERGQAHERGVEMLIHYAGLCRTTCRHGNFLTRRTRRSQTSPWTYGPRSLARRSAESAVARASSSDSCAPV